MRNIDQTRTKIAAMTAEHDRARREQVSLYTMLVRDALAAVAKYDAPRSCGTEHTIPSFTTEDLAWFKRPVAS